MKSKTVKFLKYKAIYILLALILQAYVLWFLIDRFSNTYIPIYYVMEVVAFILCIYLINRDMDSSAKVLWVILIMIAPVFGSIVYLLFGNRKIPKALMTKDRQAYSDYKRYALNNMQTLTAKENSHDYVLGKMVSNAWNNGYFPVYANTKVEYYTLGEEQFKSILETLRNAKDYIFIETFIINGGTMWDQILEILIQKASEGLDIRLMYDDFGAFTHFDSHYPKYLESKGIKCFPFNPMIPQLAIQMNNRDHRKIIVVDGKYAYTGGINIADEYINAIDRFGHWKDMGIRIEGEAVEQFVIAYLQLWNYQAEYNTPYEKYIVDKSYWKDQKAPGYCIPFTDSPTDDYNIGQNFHLNQIMLAKKYCWITTPYLVLDDKMVDAIILAAKNGVDVRIVVPGVPDKKLVYQVTKANFKNLLEHGIRIYEYTPGFIHGKVCLADDRSALVGTINMDCRSYYLNYECGIWLHDTEKLPEIKKDLENIFEECHEITLEEVKKTPVLLRAYRSFLKVFSPLI